MRPFPPPVFSDPHTSVEQEEYRLLAESIPNLAWIAGPDGSIYWYNQRWFEYTGTTPEEMVGWGWQAVHDPAELPFVLAQWRASVESGQPFEMTFPLRGADAVFRPFLTRVVPLKNADGVVLRWFGTNTEVGQEYRAVAALRKSEQRFRTATEAISGILWTNDPQGQMVGEQPGWSTFTGQTSEQYCGYGWTSAVHPDDVKPTIEAWEEAVREDHLFSFEHRLRRYDGAYRICSIRALPVHDDNGLLREWVGVHTDITEDRATQQTLRETVIALRQQEELVDAAQITNNVGFWRYYPADNSLFLSIGTRQLLGIPLTGDFAFEESFSRVHEQDLPRMQLALKDAVQSGRYSQEFRVAGPPGEAHRWILGVARVLHSAQGEPYLVGVTVDITQQKRSAEALIRTEKLTIAGRLAASIAHEINNPLEAVTNLLYLLRQTNLDGEQAELCTMMGEELQRVSEIATHTLKFYRQSIRADHTKTSVLVESVLTLFAGRLRSANIETRSRLSATKDVFGFEGELRQVIANLVGNAVDAMSLQKDHRVLQIRSRDTRSQFGELGVTITIADTGPGMASSTLDRIFDPFFTTKGATGTGLGLWISSEIVQKHQGQFQVRSS